MSEPLIAATLILVAGVGAQYLANRLHLPAILVLLPVGLLVGPVLGWVQPDVLLGDLLPVVVAVGVAIILFEGGLGLDFREIRAHGSVVTLLVTVGALVTWAIAGVAAHFLLGMPWGMALLLGALLVVSGPTVVIPLLRHVRPRKELESILRWEGILIDPIGAILAVLVFDAMVSGGVAGVVFNLQNLFTILFAGVVVGVGFALILLVLLDRYWVPDYLVGAASLTLVVLAYAASDVWRTESGLLAVTIMGVAMANQRRVSVRHVLDFKENLSVLLIGVLFILLAARVDLTSLTNVATTPAVWLFLVLLILVARPLVVALSAVGSRLSVRDGAFLAAMAPRGIVAAAVSSFFAIRLAGQPGADLLVPVTFLTILVTVALYSIIARPVAKALQVTQSAPEGVLLVGANAVTRELARVLEEQDFRTLIVDTDSQALTAARLEGRRAVKANVHSSHLTDQVDLDGIGRLWAVTPREETNALAAIHFADEFGRARVCQVALESEGDRHHLAKHLRGRTLFKERLTYQRLRDRITSGDWEMRRTRITPEFTLADHKEHYPDAVYLWLVTEDHRLQAFTVDHHPEIRPGKILVALVRVDQKKEAQERVAEARERSGRRKEAEGDASAEPVVAHETTA